SLLVQPPPPRSTLFPYTTLFRSLETGAESGPEPAQPGSGYDSAVAPRGAQEPRRRGRGAVPAGPARSGRERLDQGEGAVPARPEDRKSTRLNSSHVKISYAVFCL